MSPASVKLETEAEFRRWIEAAGAGEEMPYSETIAELVSRACVHKFAARGWCIRKGQFCVRLSNYLGESLPP